MGGIQNAAPDGGLHVCSQPAGWVEVLIKEDDTTAPFYIDAIKSGGMPYNLYASGAGVQGDYVSGTIN